MAHMLDSPRHMPKWRAIIWRGLLLLCYSSNDLCARVQLWTRSVLIEAATHRRCFGNEINSVGRSRAENAAKRKHISTARIPRIKSTRCATSKRLRLQSFQQGQGQKKIIHPRLRDKTGAPFTLASVECARDLFRQRRAHCCAVCADTARSRQD